MCMGPRGGGLTIGNVDASLIAPGGAMDYVQLVGGAHEASFVRSFAVRNTQTAGPCSLTKHAHVRGCQAGPSIPWRHCAS